MLARRLPTVLPPLTPDEALEVTRVQSVVGVRRAVGLVHERPFRAPHHTISASGLVGGGAVPAPGEASLAHHGVLFLDELSEFPRASLEALRQPLEDGRVVVVRGQRTSVFPTRFMLVAATNPCPCGHGSPPRCHCSEAELARHRRRLSGPLLDRIDLLVAVRRPSAAELAAPPATTSAEVRDRVLAARERQVARLRGTGVSCNAHLTARLLRERTALRDDAVAVLRAAYDGGHLSARGHARVLRVARTIADLAGDASVASDHVLQAIAFRQDAEAEEAAA
jgi:magnesium chelatase family protein